MVVRVKHYVADEKTNMQEKRVVGLDLTPELEKMNNNLEYFTCEVRHETAAAYLLYDGAREVWIPKSQIHDEEMSFDGNINYLKFRIPEWLALEKEMI